MADTPYEDVVPNPGLLPYRVNQLEAFRRDTESWRREVDEDRNDFVHMRDDVRQLKALVFGLGVSIVTGSAAITVSILLATGRF